MNDQPNLPDLIESAQEANAAPARRKPKRKSPTSRTLEALRERGWTCHIVEHWNAFAHIRQDAFGFGDVLAMKPGQELLISGFDQFGQPMNDVGYAPGQILLVQACAGASLAARRDKLLAEPRVATWLLSGGRVELWAWRKVGARGKQKRWRPLVQELHVQTRLTDKPIVYYGEALELAD